MYRSHRDLENFPGENPRPLLTGAERGNETWKGDVKELLPLTRSQLSLG